ncbi:hypothetical protein [Sphingobacterium sp.]|uniref:hypothetical protein n=1 Tax=Sphingobacterium sp. TaxID=341027 RepID=UPI0031DD8EF2
MNRSKNINNKLGMVVLLMTAIPNPDLREPSPGLSESEEEKRPNTNLSGLKDDRTHNKEEAQAEQKEKDDKDKPDLSGDINV